MNRIRFYAVLACVLMIAIFTACSKDSSPTSPHNGDGTPTSRTIDSGGGSVSLADGTGVVIPAGALTAATAIEVKTKSADTYFDGTDMQRTVISLSGPEEGFAAPVTIRAPLPAGMTEADSLNVFAGIIDDESGAVYYTPCSIVMEDGAPFVSITTTHFSDWLVEWLVGPTPPSAYGPLTVPYYNQGESQYCWATSVQMVSEAARRSEASEIPNIIGAMGIDEGGITSFSFRFSPTLAGIVKNRTGVKPDRGTWDYINITQMKYYLKREIGIRKHPVALFNGAWEHAVVVVGYDGDTFSIHDPASTTGAIGYTTKTWTDITGSMGAFTNMVTLAVPVEGVDSSKPEITVNILPNSLDFIKPKSDDDPRSTYYRFTWSEKSRNGYVFRESATTAVDSIPALVTELKQVGDISITNYSRTASQTVDVWLDINAQGAPAGSGHYSYNQSLSIGPNSVGAFKMPTVPVDDFRWNTTTAVTYYYSISAMVGGTVVDRQTISFVIPPAGLRITKVEPAVGRTGDTITIKGSGFGTESSAYTVVFNAGAYPESYATEVVSWKDGEIKVKLPPRSSTGQVLLREKTWLAPKESNGVAFTVDDSITLSGSSVSSPVWGEDGVFADFTMNWSLTGSYPDTLVYGYNYTIDYFFYVKTQTPVTLDFTITAEQKLTIRTRESWYDSTRYEYHYRDLKWLPPKGPDENDPENCLRVNGTFPYSVTTNGTGNYHVEMNLNRGQYHPYDYLQIMPRFEYFTDTYGYSLKAENYGALIYTDLDERDVLAPAPFNLHVGVNTQWEYWTGP